jgi:hypothetical protein
MMVKEFNEWLAEESSDGSPECEAIDTKSWYESLDPEDHEFWENEYQRYKQEAQDEERE